MFCPFLFVMFATYLTKHIAMRKKKTRQKKVLYGELGSFCIDFAKYMATGVVITTLLKDLEGHNALIYSGGFVLVSGFLFLGLLFIKLKED